MEIWKWRTCREHRCWGGDAEVKAGRSGPAVELCEKTPPLGVHGQLEPLQTQRGGVRTPASFQSWRPCDVTSTEPTFLSCPTSSFYGCIKNCRSFYVRFFLVQKHLTKRRQRCRALRKNTGMKTFQISDVWNLLHLWMNPFTSELQLQCWHSVNYPFTPYRNSSGFWRLEKQLCADMQQFVVVKCLRNQRQIYFTTT